MSSDLNIVDKAVKLSLVELVIGSTMHALHIPLSGQMLSLNQGFMLSRFLKDSKNRFAASKMVMEVSSVAAIMKALAPIGKKLGPMISISMQGFLYMLGVLTLGRNIFGQMLGMLLLSPWAFIQPLVSYYIIYGNDLTSAIEYFYEKNEIIAKVLWISVAAKALIAITIPLVIRLLSEEKIEKFESKIESMSKPKEILKKSTTPFRSSLRELFRPMFLASIIIMISFFVISGEDSISIFWKILRSVAIAFVLFYVTKNTVIHNFIGKLALKNKTLAYFSNLASNALKKIERLN